MTEAITFPRVGREWRLDQARAGTSPSRQDSERMDNYEVAKVLDETDMLELAVSNFFLARASRDAAPAIRDQTVQVADLSEEQID